MKGHLLAAVCFTALSVHFVFAAHLMGYAPPPIPPLRLSGFTVGGVAGAAGGTFDPKPATAPGAYLPATVLTDAVNAAGVQKLSRSGVVVGAEAGHNWQIGDWVLGLEADVSSIRLSNRAIT